MTARSFEPKFMKMSVLTAALQELTPRRIRDEDPDRAIEDWLEFARELDCPNIQISAALHPTETDVPPEAMLDPVANTLDLRKPFDKARAKRVLAAMQATGVGATDVAFFDNLLHDDNDLRKKKHDFVLRMMDAAALLGLDAVCGFVGRNQKLSMDQNLVFFEEVFVPLLKEAKARRLEYRVEQCPMPGWTVGDNFHNNIGYAPGMWIALHRICERHGVGDQFRVHYDPSHAILMGQDTRSIFQYLKDAGYDFIIGGFHVKGQVIDPKGVAAWGYGGQTVERGDCDRKKGKPSPNPADQVNAWKKQTVLCEHELPGIDAVTFGFVALSALMLRARPTRAAPVISGRAAAIEGLRFLRESPVLLGTMSLDFLASFFGAMHHTHADLRIRCPRRRTTNARLASDGAGGRRRYRRHDHGQPAPISTPRCRNCGRYRRLRTEHYRVCAQPEPVALSRLPCCQRRGRLGQRLAAPHVAEPADPGPVAGPGRGRAFAHLPPAVPNSETSERESSPP